MNRASPNFQERATVFINAPPSQLGRRKRAPWLRVDSACIVFENKTLRSILGSFFTPVGRNIPKQAKIMEFSTELEEATLLRRYKRFLADVQRADGSELTVHCPNTGSMKNCIVAGSPCWIAHVANPKRKYQYTWEMATTADGAVAGINTGRANALVEEAIEKGLLQEFCDYPVRKREKKYGAENSRIDFWLQRGDEECFIEVKSVTLAEEEGQGFFPDAVTTRGTKHLRELIAVKRSGHRAALVFCVQHSGIDRVLPADHIDPAYGQTLREALAAGVEVMAVGCDLSARGIWVDKRLPVLID